MNHPTLEHATLFATHYHRDQVRKYTGEPYIEHPLAVERLLVGIIGEKAATIPMRAAAILHDTVEDTDATVEEVRGLFGREIASLVADLTDQVPLERGNRAVRKRLEAFRLSRCRPSVQTIKLCDLMDNTKSILQHDPEFGAVYQLEALYLVNVLTQAHVRVRQLAWEQLRDAPTMRL